MDRHKRRRARKTSYARAKAKIEAKTTDADVEWAAEELRRGEKFYAYDRQTGEGIEVKTSGCGVVNCVEVTDLVVTFIKRRRQEIYDTHTAALVDAWKDLCP